MSNMTATMAYVGKVFMDIMEDYMERQEKHGFDPRQGLHDLYEDLSKLYNHYKDE